MERAGPFLDNMYRADQAGRGLTYASAVAVEEVSILAYNRGRTSGLADGVVGSVKSWTDVACRTSA